MMFQVVVVQVCTALAVAAGAAAVAGLPAALTALLGGLACALPNGALAFHLALLGRVRSPDAAQHGSALFHALPLLLGELFKVVLTIGLLALMVCFYRDVVWKALIVAVGAVLLVQPFAVAWRPLERLARQEIRNPTDR